MQQVLLALVFAGVALLIGHGVGRQLLKLVCRYSITGLGVLFVALGTAIEAVQFLAAAAGGINAGAITECVIEGGLGNAAAPLLLLAYVGGCLASIRLGVFFGQWEKRLREEKAASAEMMPE